MANVNKTWFITGVSRGLGKELARACLEAGSTVIGTTRDGQSDLRATNLTVHPLDVTDAVAVRQVIDEVFASQTVDIVVNNAGYGLLSSVEDATDFEIQHVFDVNFHGPRRIMQAALPHLRRQRSGHIINISSIAGIAAAAGSGYYAATKHALEGLSQSLAREVAPLGIKVTLVEPGAFRTEFLTEQSIRINTSASDDYSDTVGRALDYLSALDNRQPGDPAKAASLIVEAASSTNPPLHLVIGPDAIRRADEMLKAFAVDLDTWRSQGMATDFTQ